MMTFWPPYVVMQDVRLFAEFIEGNIRIERKRDA